jgi:hypothetical protein
VAIADTLLRYPTIWATAREVEHKCLEGLHKAASHQSYWSLPLRLAAEPCAESGMPLIVVRVNFTCPVGST